MGYLYRTASGRLFQIDLYHDDADRRIATVYAVGTEEVEPSSAVEALEEAETVADEVRHWFPCYP